MTIEEKQQFSSRTAMLLGEKSTATLGQKRVAVFGVGGVGGYACEALARSGVGALVLFDYDTVELSNCNRQITALHSTLGKSKVEVMAQRIADINPECDVTAHNVFYTTDNADEYLFDGFDYIVDAVDTVSAKIEIISRAKEKNVPVISAMGAGNKLHGELFEVADISKTSVCPLARVMRRELKKRGIQGVKVVYSKEVPVVPQHLSWRETEEKGKPTPASAAFVVGAAGLVLAGEVVRDLAALE